MSEPAASSRPTLAAGFEEWLPYRIVRPQRVRFEEAIPGETMRTAVFLAWAADVAWQHSALVGFDRAWYSSRGLFWLVRGVRLDVFGPARANETVLVSTQVMGYRRISARRHTEVRDPSSQLLAGVEIDWVMTNDRGMPTRVPQEMLAFIAEDASFELLRLDLPEAPADASRTPICVRRRDLDPLAHVNNSVYIDYLEDTLEAAGQDELLAAIPRRYEVEFLAAAARADQLEGRAWPLETGWAFRLSRDDGTELLRARVSRL
jgi:acyl-CoA thioesterase FadM